MGEIFQALAWWLSVLYSHDDPNQYRNFGDFLGQVNYVCGSLVVMRGGWRHSIKVPEVYKQKCIR